jgi:FkbM family methyltransferase
MFKERLEQILLELPFLRKGVLFILSTKPVNEVCEQYIVDSLLRKYQQESGSDFSVIDIGAGPPPAYYEICLKYTNQVYCVEPALILHNNPYASYISRLIKYSKKGKINLFKGVISEKSGKLTFYEGKGSVSSNSSLDPNYRIQSVSEPERYLNSFEKTTVESKTYQEYFADNNIKNLLFVKIDTEGAEGRILTTMDKSNAPKILLLEVAYDITKLKEQVRRLVRQENVFQESLFINKKPEAYNSDVLGEFRFNEHLDFLKDGSDLVYGSLVLAQAGIIQKEEMLNLRRRIYSRIVLLDNILSYEKPFS